MVRSAERTTLSLSRLKVLHGGVPIPSGDVPSQHSLDGAGVEALQDWFGGSEFLQPPEMVQSLSGFLSHGVQVGRPRQKGTEPRQGGERDCWRRMSPA